MDIIKEISSRIESIVSNEGRTIIAICGAADLGKTFLSERLADELNQNGLSTEHLTLDSFMMDREHRISRGLSGYQPESHDLASIVSHLEQFKLGQAIEYAPYDHSTGKTIPDTLTIRPCSILIVDGLHSMSTLLIPYLSFSIFVSTDDDQLRHIRHEADIAKRKQSVEFSMSQADSEFDKYKQYIEPYKHQADAILILKERWDYILVNGT